jgi:very-short-patch-repair endonuclease
VQARKSPTRRKELKTHFAKQLRADATEAECRLWSILRNHQIAGLRFRRQQPVGPYIVDFYCSAAKLIVELDGDQHGADRNAVYDETRTLWLRARGYCVVRFPNGDVFKKRQYIVDSIVHHLERHGIPLPDPASSCGLRRIDPPSRGG